MNSNLKRVFHLRGSSGILGAERVVLELAKYSQRFGYQAVIGALVDEGEEEPEFLKEAQRLGFDVAMVTCAGRFDLSVKKSLRSLIDQLHIDIIHTHGYKEDFYVALAKLTIPKVATNHLWKRTTLALKVYALIDALCLRSFNKIVGVSDQVKLDMQELGISPDKISVIANGIDLERFKESLPETKKASLKQEFGFADDQPIIITVSSLTEEKGHHYLFEAINRLDNFVQVLVVGEGRFRSALEGQLESLGLSDRVCFAGRREDIGALLQLADVFVLPSLMEGLPMALLEAMAAGTIAVATDVGDVGKVMKNERNGFLVEAGNVDALIVAIKGALTSSDRKRIAERARETISQSYSAEKMAESYATLYDSFS